ncbi:hypothetical protein EDD85DRAFT_804073 [Armillaria nabsnona]|nr:hypothetical protein EDD85DRAFT_804073 [Armillaria nabsnona]
MIELVPSTSLRATSTLTPTVTDNLFSQGSITNHAVGVYFAPTMQEEVVNGESVYAAHTDHNPNLNLGGPDNSKIIAMHQLPPLFWQSNSGVSTSPSLMEPRHPVFHGWYHRYRNHTGLLRITPAQFSNPQSLFFKINGVSYELTPNAQIWPRSLNAAIGGTNACYYELIVEERWVEVVLLSK